MPKIQQNTIINYQQAKAMLSNPVSMENKWKTFRFNFTAFSKHNCRKFHSVSVACFASVREWSIVNGNGDGFFALSLSFSLSPPHSPFCSLGRSAQSVMMMAERRIGFVVVEAAAYRSWAMNDVRVGMGSWLAGSHTDRTNNCS